MITIEKRISYLIDVMSAGIFEKEQLAAMALLCAVAGENIFLLGPPGTAKSLIARRVKGVFRDARSFDYLMSRFSTPEELFGPISISKLKDYDRYERLTAGYLPSADVVFLDEIWKAGPSIQNTLLTAINEHIYQNGLTTMHLPMKILIAASNELPPKDEGMEALWDRFLVRMVSNCIANDDNFELMLLNSEAEPPEVDEKLKVTDELYRQWLKESPGIGVPSEIMTKIKWLRRTINRMSENRIEEEKNFNFYVSDRRWKKAFHLMQTSAYLNGRNEIDCSDMILLIHCLWNEPDSRARINSTVVNSLFHEVTEENYIINDELRTLLSPSDLKESTSQISQMYATEHEFTEVYNSYFAIENFHNGSGLISKWDYKNLSLTDEAEAVEFIDSSLRMPVVQIMKSTTIFSLNFHSSSNKPKKVKLMRCAGGIVVDGIPYSLSRKNSHNIATKDKTDMASPRKKEFSLIKNRFVRCVKRFNEVTKSVISESEVNMFLSKTDVLMIQEEIKGIENQLTQTEIRLNNIARIVV